MPHQAGGQASLKSRSCSAGDIPLSPGPRFKQLVMNESLLCAAPTAERDRGRMLGIIPDPTAVSRLALPHARLKRGGFQSEELLLLCLCL